MSSWSRRILALCGAFALALASQAASAKDVSIAAISGYFAQGFGVSIVNGLKKAEKDLAVRVKLIDTGNRALDYEEQFNNVAKEGSYDLVFVMGWDFADAFDDPAKGSELTQTLYSQGSDIVYNVAGPTGEGVLQASAAGGKYSSGVDIDQCGVAGGQVAASRLKDADVAVYSLIKDVV